ncbi:MAG: sodium:solute symporter family transporter [Thermoanaerobaculia bacterium]
MLLPVRDLLLLVVTAVLLALIYATIRSSREENVKFTSYSDFLFRGREAIHSLSGNLGAVFSLTGFIGATWVYALVFGGWSVIVILVVFLLLTFVTTSIVRRIDADIPRATENILLQYLQKHLEASHFRVIVTFYAILYFVLLIEELAAARLILREMLSEPVVMSLLIVLGVFTIYTYVYLGGLRAVVTADAVQILVLLAFCLVLGGTVIHEIDEHSFTALRLRLLNGKQAASLAGAIVFGFAWFGAALDFYVRLNFARRRESGRTRRFIRLSYALTFALLLLGAVFGSAMSGRIPVDAANTYPGETVKLFLNRSPLVGLLFICAFFSMMFTTIDTLMITVLQVGYYQRRRWFRRETLPTIVLVATFVSTRLDFADTSVIGIFAGSMMTLPMLAILRCFWPRLLAWLPRSPTYLLFAGVIALIVFGFRYPQIRSEFDEHFLLALLTLGSAVVIGISVTAWKCMRGGRTRD